MMEESIAEWGKVIMIGAPARVPHRHPLLKVFVTSQPYPAATTTASQPLSSNLSLLPFSQRFWREGVGTTLGSSSLMLNYSHPRYIEHPLDEAPVTRPQRPLIPVVLLTAMSTFTAWYVYRLTGQKLDLQSQVKTYAEVLQQEKQTRASLLSPHVKIITLQGNTTDTVTAKIFWDTMTNTCLIYLSGLPQATPDEYFQLWFYTAEEKFVRAKEFRAPEGTAEVNLQLPHEQVDELERVVVSLENAVSATEKQLFPTGPILLKGAFR